MEINKKILISLLTVITLTISANSYADNSRITYQCPDLENPDKAGIAMMTQGYDGWFFRKKADFRMDYPLLSEPKEYFARINKAFQQRGTQIVMMMVPPRGIAGQDYLDKTHPDQKEFDAVKSGANFSEYVKTLNSTGMITPDLKTVSHSIAPNGTHFFLARDHHWSAEGARMTAEEVAKAIKDTPIYKAISPQTFKTTKLIEREVRARIGQELQRLCTSEIPADKFMTYKTSLVAGDDADALFGDDSGEPSVLVGSSFSAIDTFNFDGFLSEKTGLDIANHALSAGGLFNAIISYTSSKQFTQNKPPFLFWEASGIYDLNDDTSASFRQLIPAAYGECSEEEAIATGNLSVKKGKGGKLISIPAEKKVSGSDYYIFIESANRALAKFTIAIDYDDEDGEWFSIDRSEHYKNEGRFFAEFNDEIESNITSISIDGISNINAEINARVCKVPANKT